ncbi:hypothetical protein FV226_23030 [Methylobacterium sp. WL12]|uniref:hypothetical protein n=1 Tax=Methylobacterium sp. WL12 TaxID=2603890 RepID=UPI0011CA491F|nr:hypothetical protein [Methylobacterium sp. WL12]TXM66793.1 hypothetical protein FV226_23030 [Methylobacterium sp. WL12]
MATPHYVVRRSRSGRFNFTVITDDGRLTGSVSTEPNGRTGTEIEQEARDKIRAIAESFATATGLKLAEEGVPCIEQEAG